MNTDYYLQQIKAERQRQDEKWGEQNYPPSFWVSIMGEEFGEMCKSLNEYMSEHDANHFDDMKAEAFGIHGLDIEQDEIDAFQQFFHYVMRCKPRRIQRDMYARIAQKLARFDNKLRLKRGFAARKRHAANRLIVKILVPH